jgi:uncharacterized ParB-like nuclease family protein
MASLPLQYFGVAFNADPFDSTATPVWSDLTVRLRGVSQAGRGRQYELDQVQAGALNAAWYDIDEALNPVNTGSAFSPNVLPYRQAVYMAQWPPAPVGGAVNLLNLANPDYTVDGSFESYATGSVPSWVLTAGAIGAPGVTTTNPQQGTKAFSYNVAAGGGTMGIGVNIPTIPGKQYTCSWYVRQTAANTTQIFINGGAGGTSTALINTYVRLTVTFTASQPTHQVYIASFATASNGTVFCDAVQHEPGAAASAFSVTGPLLRNVWTRGYVERWPTAWDSNGYEGLSSTPVVGPFAILNNAYLHTELWGSIAAKRPDYYWPLSEASGATLFADNSGNSGPSLFAVASPIGTAGSTFAPGTTTNIPGEPGRTGVRTAPVAGQEGQLNQPFTILQLGYKTPQIVGPSAVSGSITTWGMTYSFVLTRPSATLNSQVIFVRFTSLIPGNTVSFPVGAGSAGQVSPGSVTDVWGDGKPHLYTFTVALGCGHADADALHRRGRRLQLGHARIRCRPHRADLGSGGGRQDHIHVQPSRSRSNDAGSGLLESDAERFRGGRPQQRVQGISGRGERRTNQAVPQHWRLHRTDEHRYRIIAARGVRADRGDHRAGRVPGGRGQRIRQLL